MFAVYFRPLWRLADQAGIAGRQTRYAVQSSLRALATMKPIRNSAGLRLTVRKLASTL
jgi:hypothetical protein